MAPNRFKQETHKIFKVKEPCTLIDFLMSALDGISRTKAKAILSGHGVAVNRSIQTRHDYALSPGMTVAISRHKKSRVLTSPYVSIVYEDRHIVVINKAPGILSMAPSPAKMSVKKVLDDFYRSQKQNTTVHVVHRLDRDTSGLMVYAKSMEVRKAFEEHWQDIVVDRRYATLVEGEVAQEHSIIKTYLRELPSLKVVVCNPDAEGAKEAVTEYWKVSSKDGYTLLDVKLRTGRKNQIRVHTSHIGHPVVGDAKYGAQTDPMKRLGLHAYMLDFYHPMTRELMEFEIPCPLPFLHLSGKK